MRLLSAILVVCVLGLGAIHRQTDGFTILTTEAARRADILRSPRAIPDATLRLSSGATTSLLHDLRSDGRIAIVNFMYTQCFSVCLAMGTQLQQLQDAIQRRGLGEKVRLLSLSFDGADTAGLLRQYEQGMRSDPAVWQSMAIEKSAQRQALLNAFGIVVVPAPLGQYEHNAAFHILTPEGRLVRVMDLDNTESLLEHAVIRAGAGDPNE
ncbi:SCO family protein [Pollutimonas nitritireducens]|uniref:SCO family protein n=1 Tax=Pollutimonas nitritireducens TaxID=2045209 RepID=A0A2N4UCH7_9BURK|nr:SCO family protein [Pollutimonas nitritireducens]PLC52703.1 SCO family protein [Pollutimonas nitritireducens]